MSVDISSLLDIQEAIERALAFTADLGYERFIRDERSMWAVYSQIIVIGEAANRISREFQMQHPGVPWKKAISMRHRLVHGYDEINWERVWKTITSDLPKLKAAIEPLIPRED
ncbi:MAG: DUF86 domain-containing protein [Planctomycetes bacterium]|nr:DUF86 domain-containing protein [Planctomycetota bacterium]